VSRPRTLLAVHAHPDDEPISTAGILALYADRGVRTVVVTCTDGALGVGADRVEVARVRRVELEHSCTHLGVSELVLLGYGDSGMAGAASNADSGAFMNTPVERVAARLASLLEQHRPEVVVTYPADGGYGHPDHIHTHRATVAAVRDVDQVRKLYFTARTDAFRRRMQRVRDKLVASAEGAAQPPLRTPATATTATADITTVVDTSSTLVRRRAALASHRSQLDGTHWLDMPDDDFAALFDTETYVRVLDTTGTPVPETDLFAGFADISRT
jgi:LmbE family N-acetylglucosaminyl deacetylase